MQIKFSHRYPKLYNQKSALLLAVELRGLSDFTEKFIEYDTAFDGGHYPLPPAQYMVLVFLGNEMIPFTTVRRWTEEKFRYYHSNIGKVYDIGYAAAEQCGAPAEQTGNTQSIPCPNCDYTGNEQYQSHCGHCGTSLR
jgi:hypothetical protein